MKFITTVLATLSIIISVSGIPMKRDVDPSLVPEFGVQSGVNPTGTGDCDGITNDAGQIVKIPCSCPPDRTTFIQVCSSLSDSLKPIWIDWLAWCKSLNANVNAGHAVNNPGISVSFPTGSSKEDKLARIQASLVTLQNLEGPGVGCPAASTTYLAQQKATQDGTDVTSPLQVAVPTPASPPNNGIDAALVPDFGIQSGVNPTGTGDCDGTTNDAGQVVKIPCSCPPDRASFIQVCTPGISPDLWFEHELDVLFSLLIRTSPQDMPSTTQVSLFHSQRMTRVHPRLQGFKPCSLHYRT